jgi:pimeloyl-ACP methyl ester carboxylesterase
LIDWDEFLFRLGHSKFPPFLEIKLPHKYGEPPFEVAVLHGGPGGAGQLRPVAMEIGKWKGVLEPHQQARSIRGQVEELKEQLTAYSSGPWCLVGHSWGAWLGLIFAQQFPKLVRKLIMVGAPPFTEAYRLEIASRREGKLTTAEQKILSKKSGGRSTGSNR